MGMIEVSRPILVMNFRTSTRTEGLITGEDSSASSDKLRQGGLFFTVVHLEVGKVRNVATVWYR